MSSQHKRQHAMRIADAADDVGDDLAIETDRDEVGARRGQRQAGVAAVGADGAIFAATGQVAALAPPDEVTKRS